MSYIKKPAARHPKLKVNSLGLTVRDYEGSMSTLCAGCGHCLLYTSPSPRDATLSRMPSSA